VRSSLRLLMCPGEGTKSFMPFLVICNHDKCFAVLPVSIVKNAKKI
jgi:hypothetical protein